jgi:4-hydroxy-tetrahydrodipicolinate synthase
MLEGCLTALITPMDKNGEPDYDGYRRLIHLQLDAKIDGLVPAGTTGEAPTLDEAEWEKLVAIACEETAAHDKRNGRKVPVLAGCGTNATKHTVKRTRRAKELGADAALIVVPYYNKPNEEGLYAHFSAAAETGLPVVIYNVPGRTARPLSVQTIERLSKIPGVIAIKESSGDIAHIAEVIQRTVVKRDAQQERFTVLSGDDALTLPVIALGGAGVISVVSNLVPENMVALVKHCRAGHYAEGQKLFYELLPLFKAAFLESNPVPIKRAMTLAGLPAGPTRLPLGPLSPESENIIRSELTRLRI